ncbi:MAG: type II toxin-antitoxin system Phd/YefM family antitoxin [Gammaproteobacteria bacterium]|nr:type II toxin-antitoxin system Phd/YefM family antitoxin [Gammaproteobacteria bacterium]
MKTIGAAKFKTHCLALLDQLDHEGIVVTKHGKPVAQVFPYQHRCANLIGSMKGEITIHGDIMSTDIEWDAQS